MLVLLQLSVHLLEKRRVGDLPHVETRLVHYGDNSLVGLVDQLTNNLSKTNCILTERGVKKL